MPGVEVGPASVVVGHTTGGAPGGLVFTSPSLCRRRGGPMSGGGRRRRRRRVTTRPETWGTTTSLDNFFLFLQRTNEE